ncbi:MAG: hypothetical protein RID09_20655 [Coleofasciculus sp. G1-WW12-02]|uniref:hypothetical protein n=1 Tax=Coleofasciculus sp. G1-WW12-02 TaxID=3068483 RepID=UPI0032F2BDAE
MVTDSKDKDLDPKSEVVGVLADGERFWQAFTPKTVPSAAQPCKKNRRPIGVILQDENEFKLFNSIHQPWIEVFRLVAELLPNPDQLLLLIKQHKEVDALIIKCKQQHFRLANALITQR